MLQIVHCEVPYSTKQSHMQGGLWNQYTDPIEGENLMKFIHETKTKYEDKNHSKKRYILHNLHTS